MRWGIDSCTAKFRELSNSLGGIPCEGANPIAYFNNPTDLANPTMPVVEVLIVSGAVVALLHAVTVLRRRADPVPLGIWLAAIVYVLVLEPPLYFPEAFGIDGYVPAIFVHNEFSIGFLYHRLPLYILAIYPALVYLAWTIVDRLGVRARNPGIRGALVTAVCVGFVHHTIYEIFDHFGPQHLWWAWDYDVPMTQQLVGSVPMSSVVNFALVMPAAFAFMVMMIFERKPRRGIRSVLAAAVAVGVLTPLASTPGQLPVTYLDLVDQPNYDVVWVILISMLVAAGLLTSREVLRSLRERRPAALPSDPEHVDLGSVADSGLLRWYPAGYLAAYLVTFAILWGTAWSETIAADGGVTAAGTPAGSLGYVVVCFVGALAILVALIWRDRRVEPTQTTAHVLV